MSRHKLHKLSPALALGLGLAAAALLGLLLAEAESWATAQPLATQPAVTSHPNIITATGRHLERDGEPFQVRGMNYYPKDYAWDRFWISYTEAIPQINAELDLAKRLGANTARLFVQYDLFDGTNQTHLDHLKDLVERLEARDMVAIVTLFDLYASLPYSDPIASRHHISAVVNTLGITNPAILAWDVKNEIDRDYDLGKTMVKTWANAMIGYLRELDPNHLVTIGFYGATSPALTNTLAYSPAIAAEFAPLVDLVSMHYFLSERDFESDLQALQAQIGAKPLLLEEFGLHTLAKPQIPCATYPSDPQCDDPHTETEQAAYYNALLSLGQAYDLTGALFWTLNDFSYVLPGTQESHHCQGIVRDSLVNNCQVTSTLDYVAKPAAEAVRRHYDERVAYLDLFDGWVAPDTDAPPPGWSDNWGDGGALLRGYNPSNLLWSHERGKVAFSKSGILTTGLAFSPILTNVDVDRYPILAGRVYSYSVRDGLWGSDANLYVGVQKGSHVTRLLTLTPGEQLPNFFRIDLRQPPTRWHGPHTFSITLELVPQAPDNGYSATYEFDWIALESATVCDELPDPMERKLCQFVTGRYPDGLLTNWPNLRLPGHVDHAPMRDYGEQQWAISESASMLALYAALIGDQTTFDYLFDVSAPAEIGGTGAPMSSAQESPYYFASPNLCLLHWILTSTVTDTQKYSSDDWLASAPGEESRWLEALAIADQKFPDPKYRLFANCLAWGLMGATDFDPRAVGVFEDPGTPDEAFDDYLMRTYFGWRKDFSDFAPGHSGNLSYNNLMGWHYAAQLQADFYDKVLNYTVPTMTNSIQQCSTDLPRVMYDVGRHVYYSEILTPNLVCGANITVTASSTQTVELSPTLAADCDVSTRWSSVFSDDQWIALEFSRPITMDGVRLIWERAYGQAYTIDLSDDGATWRPVYTETNGHEGDNVIHFPLTTTRHVRMHGLKRGTEWGFSLWEFEIYQGGGTSSLTALDLARRAGAYAKVSGDTALWEMGRRILNWYKARYPTIAAAYDPCTGEPFPGWENGEWASIMADLAELAAEYGDYCFAHQVIEEKLLPKLDTDPDSPLGGNLGPSAFDNLETLLTLRHLAAATDLAVSKSVQPSLLAAGAPLTYTLVYTNTGLGPATGVLITDWVPVTLAASSIQVNSSGARITPTGEASFTWQVATLMPGQGGVITVSGVASPPVGGVFSLTNQATITAPGACFVDQNPDDNVAAAQNTVDTVQPKIMSKAPANGVMNAPITATVTITFSESINTRTFSYTVAPDPGGWTETWSTDDQVVRLEHERFAHLRTYTFTIESAADQAGNALSGAPYLWRFTTLPYARVYLPLVLKIYTGHF